MIRNITTGVLLLGAALSMTAVEKSYTISFGAENTSTTSLTDNNFMTAVAEGQSLIASVSDVASVFPETDCIRLSSNSKNGKFDLNLTEEAQVLPKRIVVNAARYANDRDAEAQIYVNGEVLAIPDLTPDDYTVTLPSNSDRTLTSLEIDAVRRVYIYSITVVYDYENEDDDPVEQTVAAPVFSPAAGPLVYMGKVSITCATPGASIYLTVDGTQPTTSSLLYTESFALYNDATIKAFAVKEGMNPSEVVEATYEICHADFENGYVFNFADPESLHPAFEAPAEKEWVNLNGKSITDGISLITFGASGTGNTSVRLYHSYDAGIDLRLYDGDTMTFTMTHRNYAIRKIEFVTSLSGSNSDVDFDASTGEYDWLTNTWTDSYGPRQYLVLESQLQSRISSMRVYYDYAAGVENIDYDHDEKAVYYNLQGVRVSASTPAPGLYIKVTETGVEKVLVR